MECTQLCLEDALRCAGSEHWTSLLMFRVTPPPVVVVAWAGPGTAPHLGPIKARRCLVLVLVLVAACDGAQVDIYDAAEVRQAEGRAFASTHRNITSLCLN